jgi:hypothetical protein
MFKTFITTSLALQYIYNNLPKLRKNLPHIENTLNKNKICKVKDYIFCIDKYNILG